MKEFFNIFFNIFQKNIKRFSGGMEKAERGA